MAEGRPQNIVADRLINAASQPAATAPSVSHVWHAIRQSCGLNSEFPLDVGVNPARGLVVLHPVRAEAPLKKIDNAAMFKLTGLNLGQIVGQGEQPETRIAQLS